MTRPIAGDLAGYRYVVGCGVSGGLGKMSEKLVAAFASRIDALGAEGTADAFLGKGSRIDRIMKEPRPVVIPEMVVRIRFADAKGCEGDEV